MTLALKESQVFTGAMELHLSAAGVPCEKNGKASSHTIPVRPSSDQGDNCSVLCYGVHLWDLTVVPKSQAGLTLSPV